ncbi:MAG: DUF3488 and transglutaminase-like domain-containing protein [Chromatiaceae bacterium]|nr:DUF3488 and transglutaminase-like domain-containing protein [Chromatiaceae bacterium]
MKAASGRARSLSGLLMSRMSGTKRRPRASSRNTKLPYSERPRDSQVLAMTLLIGLAWLPLIPDIEPAPSVYIGFLLVLRLVAQRWPALSPGRWILLPLTLAGIAGVFGSYQTFVGRDAGTALLTTMLVLKLLEIRRLRDVRVETVLFGFLLVSQFLFDQSPQRALYLTLLLLLDIALMADLSARTGKGNQVVLSAVRTAGKLFLQALPLALVLFVLFPRLDSPLWSLPDPVQRGRTGMSDWLEPGSLSEVVLSGETAFRVKFEGPIPPEDKLFWRGTITWHSDGRRWTGWPDGVPLGSAEKPIASEDEIAYQVDLEPSGKRWLFALDLPLRVDGKARILSDFQVLALSPVEDNRIYRAVSALSYHTGKLSPEQKQVGTQLPDNVTPRMRELVAGWQQDGASGGVLVGRALDFFRENPFHYTLFPPRLGANPTDAFLFETRKGFCEHYASSFALLMRIGGVPARIVLGYMGGEYNPIGDYLIVRQSDAHAWVEVWLDGEGWVRVDPTSAVAPERVERSALLEGLASGTPMRFRIEDASTLLRWAHHLGLLRDAIETGWRNWVLNLSSARQQRMIETLGLGALHEYGLTLALITSAGAVLGLLLVALTRTARPQDPLERIYERFCHRLARIGLPRRSSEGPVAYSRRVIAARPDMRPPVEAFIARYVARRYGASAGPENLKELRRQLQRFRPLRKRGH